MTTKQCEVCGEEYDDKGYAKSTKCYKCWKASQGNYTPKPKPVQREMGEYSPKPVSKDRDEFRQLYRECVEDAIGVLADNYETKRGDKSLFMEWTPESVVRAAATIFIQRCK